ncbi:MAG: prepilin-type N-terminal cleavage/methylation domain-containing protein [Polyangiaceae bacterium]
MTSSDRFHSDRRARRLRARLRARISGRGFTLIEMVVSLAAGLLISTAAFMMARNASRFFQSEAGITSAQFQATLGMTRLQADLRRVAFMTSPNATTDPKLCGGTAGWTPGMAQLAGIRIEDGGSVARHGADHALSSTNSLSPDALIIAGIFSTTEQFTVKALENAAGVTIYLANDGAMWRTRQRASQGGPALDEIFRAGRYLRVVDQEGRFAYGLITGTNLLGTNVEVNLAASPALPTRAATGSCGCEGFCTGAIANPVSRVLYDLRTLDLATYPQYAGLYATVQGVNPTYVKAAATPARTELVRVELDENDAEIPASLEVLAEFAVDLKFGITQDIAPVGGAPNLVRLRIGDPNVYNVAGPLPAGTPERVRAVQIRFSTRAERRDRERDLPLMGQDLGRIRYDLGTNNGFVRMRTLVSDVQLVNQQTSS